FSREEDCTSEGSSQTDGWHRKVYADGAVFVVDAYTAVPAQRTEEENKKDKFGIRSVKHPVVQDALNRIAWNEVPFPRFSFPVQAAKRDIRIRNQAGCFTFHVPDMSFLDELKLTIRRLKIPHGNKG